MWSLGFHTGIDFVGSDTIYATCNGTVYKKGYSSAYGNHVYIYDETNKYYHHFCHLAEESPLTVGSYVTRNTIVGTMGATGNVTGKHLHYELMKNSIAFVAENFVDPTTWLKIPNKKGTYNWEDYQISEPIPPTPTPSNNKKKRKYKFMLFKRKNIFY